MILSEANLVEIDLLRGGLHTVAAPESLLQPSDYRVCIHRACSEGVPSGPGVVRFGVRDPLPNIGIPLRGEDPDVVLHLGAVFAACYDGGAFGYREDYSGSPDPPLRPEDAEWAREILSRAGACLSRRPSGNEVRP